MIQDFLKPGLRKHTVALLQHSLGQATSQGKDQEEGKCTRYISIERVANCTRACDMDGVMRLSLGTIYPWAHFSHLQKQGFYHAIFNNFPTNIL